MTTQDHTYKISADLIRVIAGIMVVAIHISTYFVNYPPLFKSFDWWIANLLDSASRVAVPLFVMLSGMLLLNPEKQYTIKQFFSKRVKRVAIPIISWLLIFYLFKIFYFHQHLTPFTLVKDLISLNIYYHLYYLFIIVGLYLVTPFLKAYLAASSEKLNRYLLIFSFAIPILVFITNYIYPSSRITLNAFTYFLYYIPYFFAGHFMEKVRLNKKQMLLAVLGYSLFAVTTALFTFWQVPKDGFNNHFFYEHFSITVVLMSLLLFSILNNLPRFIQFSNKHVVGSIKATSSYVFGIYLIHPIFMVLIDDNIHALNTRNIHHFIWAVMIFKIALVFGLSYTVVAMGKKLPLVKAIFG